MHQKWRLSEEFELKNRIFFNRFLMGLFQKKPCLYFDDDDGKVQENIKANHGNFAISCKIFLDEELNFISQLLLQKFKKIFVS